MKTIKCPTCGNEAEMPAKFCNRCGAALMAARNLVECRTCGQFVAKNAKKCPHCGAHTPNKKTYNAAICAIVLIGIWIIVMIFGLPFGEVTPANPTPSPNASPVVELTEEEKASKLLDQASAEFQNDDYMGAIELCDQIIAEYPNTEISANMNSYIDEQLAQFPQFSAPDLMAEYDANIVNADEKYTGTVVVITGTVTKIGKTNNDKNLCVMLDANAYFAGVQLNFKTSQTEAVAALREGDTITAIGECTGISGIQFLVLDGNNVMIEDCYIIDR